MKKIIVNGRFLTHRTTGVERYAREILLELDKIVQPNEIEMLIPPEVENWPQYKRIRVKKIGKFHGNIWEQISLPFYVFKEKGISLNLCNTAPLVSPGVVCLFDTKIKAYPEFYNWKFLIWYNLLFSNSIFRSRLIITDSESAKVDFLHYYPRLHKKGIEVIYPSWQHFNNLGFDERAITKFELENTNFYFAMGSMEPNKNFKWIAETALKNKDKIFVIAGAINNKVFRDGLGFECPTNVKLIGFVSDEEAKTLMRDCTAFIFPSICEGFGMPPLEALSAGCKSLIVSDIPVMHEIFKDKVIYINPHDTNVELDNLLSLSKEDAEYILNKYSWEKSARKLLGLLSAQ